MTTIRDIRADLIARIEGISLRKDEANDRHDAELRAIENDEKLLRAMLELEEKRLKNGHDKTKKEAPLRPGAASRIESEILELMSDKHEWTHGAIKDHLIETGYGSADDSHFGQSLQGILLSMRGRELIDLPSKRVWQITKKGLTGP